VKDEVLSKLLLFVRLRDSVLRVSIVFVVTAIAGIRLRAATVDDTLLALPLALRLRQRSGIVRQIYIEPFTFFSILLKIDKLNVLMTCVES